MNIKDMVGGKSKEAINYAMDYQQLGDYYDSTWGNFAAYLML
jgi:hypothetical protein